TRLVMLFFVLVAFVVGAHAAYHDTNCASGRTVITHLFEWRWDDIAEECERFLGPYGYCGVQVSPPSENAVITNPFRPWWERYQPVSYHLVTRSGDENAFRNMVERCNRVNVRIFPDAVINHMTGAGGSGSGTGGSHWDGGALSYPGVPFGSGDFNRDNCPTADGNIHNYGNPTEVRNCKLVNLADLALSHDYVRGKIADYMNHMIDIGVAGFRVDAAKHMWPGDLQAIFGRFKNLRSDIYGGSKTPLILQEVIDQGGEPIKADEYLATGRVTNFKYGLELGKVFRRQNPMKYLVNFGEGWGMWSGNDVVNFIDNHDNQRGHGGAGGVLTHKEPRPYKVATAFMLAHPYGLPRVMSSFSFSNTDQGPPNNGAESVSLSSSRSGARKASTTNSSCTP
ncbi:alpha-amylase family glycosyl hydrolase, partial [Escherichia coli]|nr:alpha-amylase family glycosyl hydrolase [Escherichia coli]